MAPAKRDQGDAKPAMSTQVFQILLSLLDQDLHGYALIQDIRRRTDGEIALTASTLYAATKRLLSSDLIAEIDAPSAPPPNHDTRRRYYRITARGRAAARQEALRLERLTAMAREKRLLGTLRTSPQPKGSR